MNTLMKFDWYPVRRQALPSVLLGIEKPLGTPLSGPFSAGVQDVLLWMASPRGDSESSLPAVALVGPSSKEVFAWVSTYAEEIFPLSQFCRVLSTSDWADAALENSSLPTTVGAVNPVWPSLILGEMLGQTGSDPDVASIPLSRASACFSFAMARAALLYPEREGLRLKCADRLSMAEREPRFGRRHITTDSLKQIWVAALALARLPSARSDFVGDLLKVLGDVNPKVLSLFQKNKALLSDSAEERVTGFDLVVDALFAVQRLDSRERNERALSLAAAALLAGRGTSHIQLLAPASRELPEVFVWYGLLAGVVGQKYWDKAWTQQAKGVERGLRQYFRADEPVQADICWAEYEWLAQTYDSVEMFTSLPRSFPGGLAIELLPGVVCQFRLSEHGQAWKSSTERSAVAEPEQPRISISPDAISKALEMLSHVQQLLQGKSEESTTQPGLFGEQEVVKNSKTKRTKSTSPTVRRPRS